MQNGREAATPWLSAARVDGDTIAAGAVVPAGGALVRAGPRQARVTAPLERARPCLCSRRIVRAAAHARRDRHRPRQRRRVGHGRGRSRRARGRRRSTAARRRSARSRRSSARARLHCSQREQPTRRGARRLLPRAAGARRGRQGAHPTRPGGPRGRRTPRPPRSSRRRSSEAKATAHLPARGAEQRRVARHRWLHRQLRRSSPPTTASSTSASSSAPRPGTRRSRDLADVTYDAPADYRRRYTPVPARHDAAERQPVARLPERGAGADEPRAPGRPHQGRRRAGGRPGRPRRAARAHRARRCRPTGRRRSTPRTSST